MWKVQILQPTTTKTSNGKPSTSRDVVRNPHLYPSLRNKNLVYGRTQSTLMGCGYIHHSPWKPTITWPIRIRTTTKTIAIPERYYPSLSTVLPCYSKHSVQNSREYDVRMSMQLINLLRPEPHIFRPRRCLFGFSKHSSMGDGTLT
jgi:hypothetical protein